MTEEVAVVASPRPVILLSDPSRGTTARASSVLQKNTKLYGPMNALTTTTHKKSSSSSSSWNSEGNCEGDTYLLLQFSRPVHPTTLKFQFQAGFSALVCRVWAVNAVVAAVSNKREKEEDDDNDTWQETTTSSSLLLLDEMELEDVHELQECKLGEGGGDNNNNDSTRIESVQGLKLVLQDFTDFYGRVILYRLEIWGHET